MPTNRTLLKCQEYPCLRICSADDTKVDIDWICTRSKPLLQPETNEHRTKTGKQLHRIKIKQTNMWKSHLVIITRKKNNLEGWFQGKIDLKSPLFYRLRRRKKGVTARVGREEKRERTMIFTVLFNRNWNNHCIK
jgi:hypothetical protein